MVKLLPKENPQPRPAVIDYIRQFARQFRPATTV